VTEFESRHLIAAHAVIEKLQRDPSVQLTQLAGKDIIAQALADIEAQALDRGSVTNNDGKQDYDSYKDDPDYQDEGAKEEVRSRPWSPEPGKEVRVVGSPYKHLNGLVGKVMGRHVMHPNPNLWEVKIEVNGDVWNLDTTWLIASGPPLHLETDPQLLLDAVRGAVVDHIRTGDSGHLRDAVSGLANLVEQLLKRRECP
jgi:hypothetical protein